MVFMAKPAAKLGNGDSSVVERPTEERKITGSSSGRSVERISSPTSIFCADSYFGICSPAVALKTTTKIRPFCQNEHTGTLRMWL